MNELDSPSLSEVIFPKTGFKTDGLQIIKPLLGKLTVIPLAKCHMMMPIFIAINR